MKYANLLSKRSSACKKWTRLFASACLDENKCRNVESKSILPQVFTTYRCLHLTLIKEKKHPEEFYYNIIIYFEMSKVSLLLLQVFTTYRCLPLTPIKEKKHPEEFYSLFGLGFSNDVHKTHAGP